MSDSSSSAARSESLSSLLTRLADRYPGELRDAAHKSVARIAFNMELVLHRTRADSICDIGGGTSLFSLAFAALGRRSVLVDDFDDPVNRAIGTDVLELHREHGVQVVAADALEVDLSVYGPFAAVTSFDSLEHWHHSPKRLFRSVAEALVDRGVFVLGVPNCVNARKRLTVPLGRGKWSPMNEWYEMDRFRGHVREPDVDDLQYIARDMGLEGIEIHGRNWMGHNSPRRVVRAATKVVDGPLRLRPSLCSDIYLVGRRVSRT